MLIRIQPQKFQSQSSTAPERAISKGDRVVIHAGTPRIPSSPSKRSLEKFAMYEVGNVNENVMNLNV